MTALIVGIAALALNVVAAVFLGRRISEVRRQEKVLNALKAELEEREQVVWAKVHIKDADKMSREKVKNIAYKKLASAIGYRIMRKFPNFTPLNGGSSFYVSFKVRPDESKEG